MRTWGRTTDPITGKKTWVKVETDANGFNDAVYLTTLCQVLLLNLNESPFFANYGLPAQQSVIQQIQPDYYVSRVQQQFSQYFASLIIAKIPLAAEPSYRVAVTTNQGSKIVVEVPV